MCIGATNARVRASAGNLIWRLVLLVSCLHVRTGLWYVLLILPLCASTPLGVHISQI